MYVLAFGDPCNGSYLLDPNTMTGLCKLVDSSNGPGWSQVRSMVACLHLVRQAIGSVIECPSALQTMGRNRRLDIW
jgi:hypothetical protein